MNKVTCKKLVIPTPKVGQIYRKDNDYYILSLAGNADSFVCINLKTGRYWKPEAIDITYACGNLTYVLPGSKITIEVME